MTENGEVVNGKHRQQAGWDEVKKLPVKDKKDVIALRLILNAVRRNMPAEEKSSLVNELAELLLQRGVEKKNLVKAITDELGLYSTRWVYKYLDRRFKETTKPSKLEGQENEHCAIPPYRKATIFLDNALAQIIDNLTYQKKLKDFNEAIKWLVLEALKVLNLLPSASNAK